MSLTNLISGKLPITAPIVDYDLFKASLSEFRVIDARNGGLVIGSFHKDGGIWFARFIDDDNLIIEELEGYEYIINKDSSTNNIAKLEQLNKYNLKSNFEPYEIPPETILIDARNPADGKRVMLLFEEGQFVVNKHATKKYLEELEKLNNLKSSEAYQ